MDRKPTVPEVIGRFITYGKSHPSWGSLHIVFEDSNFDDHWMSVLERDARAAGDHEGAELAAILSRMSYTQRRKIDRLANAALNAGVA